MAINTNTEEYKNFWDSVSDEGGMAAMSLPMPGTGIITDLWWIDENDFSKGITGKDSEAESERPKRFLWMPMKYGIPVAIVGVAVLGYGLYKLYKHHKKSA